LKKWINLALSTVLLAGVAAGCSGGSSPNGNTAPSPQPAEGSKPAENVKKEPAKFSIVYPTTVGTGYHTKVPDLNKDKYVLKLEELSNTDLDVRVLEDSKFGLMFAGGDIPDVVGSIGGPGSKSMSGSVESGVFMPLDDLLKKHGPKLLEKIPKAAWDTVSYNGKIYGIPEFLSNPSRRATYVRSDLLEKAGKQPPKTVEEFLDVLREFKKLGVQHPYQMRENFKYADVILGAYDVLPYKDQFELVNGEVVPKFFNVEKMTKALTVMKTMYDEGLIAKDFATISSAEYTKSINAGTAGFWSANASGLPGFATSIRAVDPNSKVAIIPSPKGPDGKSGYFYYSPVVRVFYINKNVNPELAGRIIEFFEWMLTEEAETYFTFGIEGDNYTKDASGKINYKFPTNNDESSEEGFRSGTLWAVHDSTYNKLRLELNDDGKATLRAFDEVLAKEGLSGIGFYPDLATFSKYPDLATPSPDVGPKLIIDYMIKMIYGKEPISNWPKVIEEYRQKGGNEIIKEATERWNKMQGAVMIDTK
jgi:putative aldouronate transport system substrate-binding protein